MTPLEVRWLSLNFRNIIDCTPISTNDYDQMHWKCDSFATIAKHFFLSHFYRQNLVVLFFYFPFLLFTFLFQWAIFERKIAIASGICFILLRYNQSDLSICLNKLQNCSQAMISIYKSTNNALISSTQQKIFSLLILISTIFIFEKRWF